MKIWRKRISRLISESVNDGGVCRTAPATPGLLKRLEKTSVERKRVKRKKA